MKIINRPEHTRAVRAKMDMVQGIIDSRWECETCETVVQFESEDDFRLQMSVLPTAFYIFAVCPTCEDEMRFHRAPDRKISLMERLFGASHE